MSTDEQVTENQTPPIDADSTARHGENGESGHEPTAPLIEKTIEIRYVELKPPESPNRLKVWIERWTRLTLGDSVNVALFVLTVVTIIVAAVTLKVAKDTLTDARQTGKDQAAILSDARDAMRASTMLLKTQNDRQEEMIAMRADIGLNIDCASVVNRRPKAIEEKNLRGPSETVWTKQHLQLPPTRRMLCSFVLENRGEGPLSDGWLVTRFIPLANGPVKGPENMLERGGEIAHPVTTLDGQHYIQVIKNRTLFPVKQTGYRQMPESLSLLIPEGVQVLMIEYRFGGHMYPEKRMNILIDLYETH